MRTYTVHSPPPGRDRAERVLLREGFSWPAAIFTVLWALWHRMWLVALALLAVGSLVEVALAALGADPAARLAVGIGYALVIGYIGNDLRRWSLERRGWTFEEVVAARDADTAFRRLADLTGDDGGGQRYRAGST